MSQRLEELYQAYWMLHTKHLMDDFEPLEIAGVLVAQAMTIYKTLLTEEEFEMMVDSIVESKDKVKKLDTGRTLQ